MHARHSRVRLVLVYLLAEVVARVDAQIVAQLESRGPARIERVERTDEREVGKPAIAVVRVLGQQIPPRRSQLRVAKLDGRRIAIRVGLETNAKPGSRAEQIELLHLKAGGVLAAAPAEREPGVEAPDILCGHLQVDEIVPVGNGPDERVAQIPARSQDSRGLRDRAGVVRVPFAKQQLVGDGRVAGLDVQAIAQPEEHRVLVAPADIEKLEIPEYDLADAGTAGFERGVVGYAGRALVVRLVAA